MLKGIERDTLFLKLVAEGLYTVSETGVMRKYTGKVIGNKAEFVVIGRKGNYFSITRTRAMWLVLKGPIPEVEGDSYYVCLKDKEQPLHIDNLELKLRTEVSREVGKRMVSKINCRASAKMTDEQVLALRREFVANPKAFIIRQRAKQLGIAHASLSFALSGKTYAHIEEAVPKELMAKPGGNMRPRVWDRRNCPSQINRPKRAPTVKAPAEPKPKPVSKPKPKTVEAKPKVVISDQAKRDRLEMMKRIGNKLNQAKTFN
jgi:hypothetical protein